MLHFGKIRGTSLRLMILIGLLIISVIPMPSSASAQMDQRLFGSSARFLQVSSESMKQKGWPSLPQRTRFYSWMETLMLP
jgi:hypothetical protein